MGKELLQEYEFKDYPVTVKFIERKKDEGSVGEWINREGETELIIVNNGELRVTCNNRNYKASAGQGMMIFTGSKHCITSSTKEDTAFYSVVFSPSFAFDTKKESAIFEKYQKVLGDNFRDSILVMDEANLRDESALDRINSIIVANTIKKPGYELLTKGYICMLWVLLLDYLTEKETPYNGKNLPSQDELRVKSAVAFMKEAYTDPITLEDIAGKIHISRNECCRCFKRVLMVTPVEFLIRLRVFEAAKLLYKDPASVGTISELGFLTGFNNTSYFNRMFKRYLDCTPREFSKMLKLEPDKARNLYENLQESVTGIF